MIIGGVSGLMRKLNSGGSGASSEAVIFTTSRITSGVPSWDVNGSEATKIDSTTSTTVTNTVMSSGKWYFEVQVLASSYEAIGITTYASSLTIYPGGTGDTGSSFSPNNTRPIYINGTVAAAAPDALPAGGAGVVGVLVDMDNLTIQYFLDGVQQSAPLAISAGTYRVAVGSGISSASAEHVRLLSLDADFLHRPAGSEAFEQVANSQFEVVIPEPFGAHRHWRIRGMGIAGVTAGDGNPDVWLVDELNMIDYYGVYLPNYLGVVVSASSEYSATYAKEKAVPGVSGYWGSETLVDDDATGQWLAYDFGEPVNPSKITVLNASSNNYYIVGEVAIDYSDDGVTWTEAKQFTGLEKVAGARHILELSENFYSVVTPVMTSDTEPSPFVASASSVNTSYAAYKAFTQSNINSSDCWASAAAPSVSVPQTLTIDCGSPKMVDSYDLQNRNYTQIGSPQDWTLQVSDDGVTWATLDTVVGNTNNTSASWKGLRFISPTSARYWRVSVTSSFTDILGNIVAIAEVALYTG